MGKRSTGILLLLSIALAAMPLQAQSASQDSRFDALDKRIEDLKDFIKEGFSAINRRIDDLKDDNENGFNAINRRIDDLKDNNENSFSAVNKRIDDLKWLVGWILGFLSTAFVGVIVAIVTQYFTKRQQEKKHYDAYWAQVRNDKLKEGGFAYQGGPSRQAMPPETLVKES